MEIRTLERHEQHYNRKSFGINQLDIRQSLNKVFLQDRIGRGIDKSQRNSERGQQPRQHKSRGQAFSPALKAEIGACEPKADVRAKVTK